MALVLKYQEGGEAPKYSYSGDEYDFYDLERRVYEGFNDFISTVRNGNKNRSEILSATQDLMNGLKSGRVTRENGSFIDSEGEYHNDPKKKHDFYGIAAFWISKNMGKGKKVTPPTPETKEEYSNTLMGQYVIRDIFGSDNITNDSIQDFLDQDSWLDNKKTSKKNEKRIEILRQSIFNALSNFDNIVSKYNISDENKEKLKEYLTQAYKALEDGILDDSDYLLLTKSLGVGNWRGLMRTDFSTPTEDTSHTNDTIPQGYKLFNYNGDIYQFKENTAIDDIVDYIIESLKDHEEDGPVTNINIKEATTLDEANYRKALYDDYMKYNFELLIYELQLYPLMGNNNGPAFKAIVLALKNKGLLTKIGEDTYVIEGVTNSEYPNHILTVNLKNNTYQWISKYSLPKEREKIKKLLRLQDSDIKIVSSRKGGSLKFNGGGRVLKGENDLEVPESFDYKYFIDNFSNLSDDELNKIILDIEWNYTDRYRNVLENGKIKHELRGDHYATNGEVPGDNDYDPEPGGKETENQPFYSLWYRILTNREDVARNFAKRYALLETGSNNDTRHFKSWFDSFKDMSDEEFNKIDWNNYDWDKLNSGFNFENFKTSASKYGKDEKNGIFHDFTKGKLYFTKDKDGNKTYYKKTLDGYTASETAADESLSELFDEYELIKDATPEVTEGESDDKSDPDKKKNSRVNDNPPLGPRKFDWAGTARSIIPEGLSASRLIGTLANNNKAYKVLNRALHPYLQDTYERYSPITGEFGLMSAYNLLAADYNRLADKNATSDASINYLARLDANRRANQLREQGFLKDNDEIKRTATEALLRQEDNAKRKSETANLNMKSINDTNREKSQLEAERIKQNWSAWDNFLGGIELRLRTDQLDRKNAFMSIATDAAKLRATNLYNTTMYPWQLKLRSWANNPDNANKSITDWPEYDEYVETRNDALNAQLEAMLKTAAQLYKVPYNTTYTFKKGGKLIKRKK